MIQSPRNKSLMGKAVGAYHVEDYDSTNFTRRNKSKWSTVGGALDGGSVGAAARPVRNIYRGEGYTYHPVTTGCRIQCVNFSYTSHINNVIEFTMEIDNASSSYWFVRGGNIDTVNYYANTSWALIRGGNVLRPVLQIYRQSDSSIQAIQPSSNWIVLNEKHTYRIETDAVETRFYRDGALIATETAPTEAPQSAGNSSMHLFGRTNNTNGAVGRLYGFRWSCNGTLIANFTPQIQNQASSTVDPESGRVWTVTRPTSGLKTAVVNKLTGSHALYGTDKFAEVADHPALNFGAGEAFTAVSLMRTFDIQSNGSVLVKRNASINDLAQIGWYIRRDHPSGTRDIRFGLSDGDTQANGRKIEQAGGTLHLISATISTGSVTLAIDDDSASFSAPVGSFANSLPLRVGRGSGTGTNYVEMEESFIAIFRHALTSTDLTRLKWEAETFARHF